MFSKKEIIYLSKKVGLPCCKILTLSAENPADFRKTVLKTAVAIVLRGYTTFVKTHERHLNKNDNFQ